MPNVERTRVGIGRTDGYRYIGVIPPLTDVEIENLVKTGVLEPGQVEQISSTPKQSLIHLGETLLYPSDDYPAETARNIAAGLRETRGEVILDLNPVSAAGVQIFNSKKA